MAVTVFYGPMGSGKTLSAVEEIVLKQLKQKRPVITNITGLDHAKVSQYLKMSEAEISDLLTVVQDEEINDDFWPDDDQGGKVPWGSTLVLDEAWKFLREKEKLTPKFWAYLRKHRKWAAGDPPHNCEIVFITQSKTDLPRSIMSVVDQMWGIRKNLFSGLMSLYSMTLYQPGQRQPLLHKNMKYNKDIFSLYKSHAVDGVVEVRASDGGSWLSDRKTYMGLGALLLFVVGLAWIVPAMLTGHLMPTPKSHNPPPTIDPNGKIHTVAPAAVAAPSSAAVTLPGSSSPGAVVAGAAAPLSSTPASTPGAPLGANIASRVLHLRGDPDAAKSVGDAFCARSGDCQIVVNAATQQVVLVGSDNSVQKLEKLLTGLAVRPPSQLVHVLLFEADDTAANDLNIYAGVTGGSSFQAGHTTGAGVSGNLTLGSFTVAFNHLVGTGSVKLLSSPELMVWPGQTASLKSGLSVPILGQIIVDSAGRQSQVLDYRDSGLLLSLTQVSSGDRPVLKLDIESSSYGDTQVGVTGQPTKTQRVVSSMVELPECQVVVLGGLDQFYSAQQVQKVFGVTVGRTNDGKQAHMFVALYGDPPSSAHACAAQGSAESATSSS